MVGINTSTCKKFITEENDVRASKDAIALFQEKLNKTCSDLGKVASEKALEDKRKTVMPQDIEAAFDSSSEDSTSEEGTETESTDEEENSDDADDEKESSNDTDDEEETEELE